MRCQRPFQKRKCTSLTDQIRRASRSIGGQIAEAWGKRRYERHFISKLTDADGEQLETQHWIETAVDCKYLQQEKAEDLLQKCFTIGKMLFSMIDKAPAFCRKHHLACNVFSNRYSVLVLVCGN